MTPSWWKKASLIAPTRLTLVLLAAGALSQVAAADIVPYEAVYRVEFKGMRVGEATFVLHEEDENRFTFRSSTRTKGLAKLMRRARPSEESVFSVVDGRILPERYAFSDGTRKGEDNSAISFDWAAGRATSEFEGEIVDLSLEEAVLDRMTLQLRVMQDLSAGRIPERYLLAYRNRLRSYDYTDLGQARIDTRAGSFDTVKFAQQREGSSRRTLLWLAPELLYLPVYIEQQRNGKTQLKFSLDRITGIPPATPAAE